MTNGNVEVLRIIMVQDHELPIYGTIEQPLFLALDVAKMIDYSVGNTNAMLSHVDDSEKVLISVSAPSISMNGGRHNTPKWFLTEYGLYEVLMQSRKPVARRFKSAVKDTLRDLRLKGAVDFEDWLNYEDPYLFEWEKECRQREAEGIEERTWVEFLESKGWTGDMF